MPSELLVKLIGAAPVWLTTTKLSYWNSPPGGPKRLEKTQPAGGNRATLQDRCRNCAELIGGGLRLEGSFWGGKAAPDFVFGELPWSHEL